MWFKNYHDECVTLINTFKNETLHYKNETANYVQAVIEKSERQLEKQMKKEDVIYIEALIKEGKEGIVFQQKKWDDLLNKTEEMIQTIEKRFEAKSFSPITFVKKATDLLGEVADGKSLREQNPFAGQTTLRNALESFEDEKKQVERLIETYENYLSKKRTDQAYEEHLFTTELLNGQYEKAIKHLETLLKNN